MYIYCTAITHHTFKHYTLNSYYIVSHTNLIPYWVLFKYESSMELWAETLNIITDILSILLLIIVSSSILFPFITQLGCVAISNFEYFNLK